VTEPLLVASVYSPSQHNAQWLALQQAWLAMTLGDQPYRFGIVLNGVDDLAVSGPVEVVARLSGNQGHAAGLAHALSWFRASSSGWALLLDSDAFPIKPGWLAGLKQQMGRFRRRIAAPVRFENLDRFPHPSAMLVERSVIDEPWFSLQDGIEATNLLDDVIRDVAASMVDRHGDVLPLLRSNALNLHPIAAAIYGDCFYHHGAGSRAFRFRSSDRYSYFEGWPIPVQDPAELQRRLFHDPAAFIELLRRGPEGASAS